jgi:hypothetical protein
MSSLVNALAGKYPSLLLLQIDADVLEEITESFEIDNVPSFIVLRVSYVPVDPPPPNAYSSFSADVLLQGHTLLARITGADAVALTDAITKHVGAPPPLSEKTPTTDSEAPEEHLRGLMNQSTVVLFMKGSPDTPRCGFSRKICGLLQDNKIQFSHFDILTDESVRQGEFELPSS